MTNLAEPRAAERRSPSGEQANSFLRLEGISKEFGAFLAVNNVSLKVHEGEFVSILGPSGCGKTTLLRIVAGLEEQSEGRVYLQEQDISRQPPARRGCGIVFQSYALFPNMTAGQNVAYGLNTRGRTRAQTRERVHEMLSLVGLGHYEKKYPAQLSGGEQQRVALARALAPEPKLLLLDEPLSALDARVRVRLRREIRNLQKRLNVTTIMVTHDQEEALTMADRVVIMSGGRLIQNAPPQQVYHRPVDAFVADFIGAMNFLGEGAADGDGSVELAGTTLNASQAAEYDQDDRVLTAIRPEDVRLHAESGPNRLSSVVRFVEFRGSFYRVRCELEALRDGRGEAVMEVDVQPMVLESLSAAVGDVLHVELPPDRILLFPSPDALGEPKE
jgi:iron(III) transport system ATP-binding protein